jgi:hypothetical protein
VFLRRAGGSLSDLETVKVKRDQEESHLRISVVFPARVYSLELQEGVD